MRNGKTGSEALDLDEQWVQENRLIESWLADTSELFDDWEWDGQELTMFWREMVMEKYPRNTLEEYISGLAQTTLAAAV